MKKIWVITFLLVAVAITQLFYSCKHEIVDACASNPMTLTLTKIDALPNQTGEIFATASGGDGISYRLNNGPTQDSGHFVGLAPLQNYTVIASNSRGCSVTASIQLGIYNPDPCTNTNIAISTSIVNATPCTSTPNNGSITVNATGSSGFTYNINGGNYQANNTFTSLASGNYTIGAKDLNGCIKTVIVAVRQVASGPLFADVRALITTRCAGNNCHMNGSNSGGYNFDNDCSIVNTWNQIKAATDANRMPIQPNPILTAAEKLKISNWVNAGHSYTN